MIRQSLTDIGSCHPKPYSKLFGHKTPPVPVSVAMSLELVGYSIAFRDRTLQRVRIPPVLLANNTVSSSGLLLSSSF